MSNESAFYENALDPAYGISQKQAQHDSDLIYLKINIMNCIPSGLPIDDATDVTMISS